MLLSVPRSMKSFGIVYIMGLSAFLVQAISAKQSKHFVISAYTDHVQGTENADKQTHKPLRTLPIVINTWSFTNATKRGITYYCSLVDSGDYYSQCQ